MNTSIVTTVLAGMLLAGQNATPTWQTNYSQAQEQGTARNKPLAVVFGAGANGWSKLVSDDSPSPEVLRLLANKYVCVYVDTASTAGQKLAETFGVNKLGVVLSNRKGDLQAFRHEGDMSNQNLARYLQKYADPDVGVTTTETNPGTSRTSFYPPQAAPSMAPDNQNLYLPASSS